MDYEKKYKEALERAKKFEEKYGGGYAGYIFPELEESEDEKTRRFLLDYAIEMIAGLESDISRSTYDGIKGHDQEAEAELTEWQKARVYLEKQKEGEKEVSALFDSTDSYNKGFKAGQEKSLQELKEHIKEDKTQCYAYDAGYAAGFIVGKEQGWKEHKAFVKEDSKTADSIPSNCMSDAKCEDRWHKVADSLPDNPREVLCKDAAGNYFIGRYYVGEGWEISNYDDEDKPHHLNPPVSKWIDFPSEKQKEQKPAEWSEDKFPKDIEKDASQFCFDNGINITPHQAKQIATHYLMVGHNEGYIEGRKNAHIPARELGLPSSCDFQKEQKPAWSEEDEEMIGCIIDDIREAKRNSDKEYFKELCDKEIAWLKSIRPDTFQNGNSRPKSPDNWKPSEEQIEALHTAVYLEEMQFYGGLKDKLRDLYEQLKKL